MKLSSSLAGVRGLIFDLDGTLYYGGKAIPGSRELVQVLRQGTIPFRFVTNTDSMSVAQVEERIARHGLEVISGETFTPWVAVRGFFAAHSGKTGFFVTTPTVEEELRDLPWNDVNPDFVVVGSCNERVSFPLFNQVLRYLRRGADLLTTSTAGWFVGSDGLEYVDTGAFAALFAYAAGKKARCLGKPSADFLLLAAGSMGVQANDVAVIGDDLDADIVGARAAGMRAILVRTGKFTEDNLSRAEAKPDVILDSVDDLLLHRA